MFRLGHHLKQEFHSLFLHSSNGKTNQTSINDTKIIKTASSTDPKVDYEKPEEYTLKRAVEMLSKVLYEVCSGSSKIETL